MAGPLEVCACVDMRVWSHRLSLGSEISQLGLSLLSIVRVTLRKFKFDLTESQFPYL